MLDLLAILFIQLNQSRLQSCFTVIVFLVPCDCESPMAPYQGAVGWSAMYGYAIS